MAPFPLCCLAGAASGDAAAAAAALSMGLATGAAMHWLYTAGPELRDESSSLEAVVAEHRRTSERTDRCNGPLVLVGACGAATAAVAARGTRAAAPLALSAALNLGLIAFTLGVVGPLQRTIYASAGNKSDQGATRAALRRWAGLHKARIVVSLASCGAAVCGVLLWNKKSAHNPHPAIRRDMALACSLLRPAAPRVATSSCRCRLGSLLAAPPCGRRWGGSLAGGAAAPAAAADAVTPSSSSSSSAGRGSIAATAAVRDDLLKGVAAENREDVARIVEQAQRAADSWTVVHSDFYTPPVVADAMAVLQRMADVAAVPWGGYPQAERCRLSLGREEALAGAAEDPSQLDSVAAVQCRGNFMFDPATHRDFLGACLGTGIERSKVGDIVVTGEQGCQILCSPALVEHLEAELTQVRTVPVQTQAISLSELQVRAPRIEEISSVEASLRLDAVASAGFRVSRSKMMDMIKAGDVRVNWRSGCKPSSEVKAGDVISVAGKGRLEVRGASMTKKGKYSVQMARFL